MASSSTFTERVNLKRTFEGNDSSQMRHIIFFFSNNKEYWEGYIETSTDQHRLDEGSILELLDNCTTK